MAFFTRKDKEDGRLYILKMYIDNQIVYKIGITKSERIEDRMCEILTSFFKVYRYIPKTVLKRHIKTKIPNTMERHLHHILKDYSITFDKKFNGYTEFFTDIDEKTLLDYIDTLDLNTVLDGVDRIPITEYEYIKEKLDDNAEELLTAKIPF